MEELQSKALYYEKSGVPQFKGAKPIQGHSYAPAELSCRWGTFPLTWIGPRNLGEWLKLLSPQSMPAALSRNKEAKLCQAHVTAFDSMLSSCRVG